MLLPGNLLNPFVVMPPCEGHNCECDKPSTKRIVGECDSFGYEEICLCDSCYELMQKDRDELYNQPRWCDWCKSMKEGCIEKRDPDEGMFGPVYMVCPACREALRQAIEKELMEEREDFDYEDRFDEFPPPECWDGEEDDE